MSNFLYQQLYQRLLDEIQRGQRQTGDRLPSVRQICGEFSLSRSTVLSAYARLEAEGWVEARPRSGYFVKNDHAQHKSNPLKTPQLSQPEPTPALVTSTQIIVDIMDKGAAFDVVADSEDGIANQQLRRCMARGQRQQTAVEQLHYNEPSGLELLRTQIAHRMAAAGKHIDANELITTNGCQNALMLALMATTTKGDVVAIESPGFYGVIQLLELLGLKALELPSSAETGLSPDALELALQHWDIKAVVLSPCFATPTGSCMPENHKEKILAMTQSRGVPIIEDDIYGDLCFGFERPRTIHSYDRYGSVLLCSSLSKSLSRDLRLGWIAPGRYYQRVKQLKLITSLSSSSCVEKGVAAFLQEGGFDRHLRQKRLQLSQQCEQLLELIPQALPQAVSCSEPTGGMSLWVEFRPTVDTMALYTEALANGVVITPGGLFTSQPRYSNAIRLSFASPWTDGRKNALDKLGQLIS